MVRKRNTGMLLLVAMVTKYIFYYMLFFAFCCHGINIRETCWIYWHIFLNKPYSLFVTCYTKIMLLYLYWDALCFMQHRSNSGITAYSHFPALCLHRHACHKTQFIRLVCAQWKQNIYQNVRKWEGYNETPL